MKRTTPASLVLGLLLCVNHPVFAATYRLEGQITGGFLVHDFPVPPIAVPFPVPYTGVFDYQPQLAQATFEFTADMSPLPPIHVLVGENLFDSVLQEDAAALVVDFSDPGVFYKYFDFNLNKSTGLGNWELTQGCLVCDFSISPPNAIATITSYSVIPEPAALTLV